jgi:hypothetical protein
MALRGLLRILSLNTTTQSSLSFAPYGALQNDTLFNTTSAIPDLSATADTFGDSGFIKHIPAGVEVCITIVIIYMYIHCYVGGPREIWRQWKQRKVPTDSVVLLDDQSSVTSRTSIHSIDCSMITQSSNHPIQLEDEQSSQTNK